MTKRLMGFLLYHLPACRKILRTHVTFINFYRVAEGKIFKWQYPWLKRTLASFIFSSVILVRLQRQICIQAESVTAWCSARLDSAGDRTEWLMTIVHCDLTWSYAIPNWQSGSVTVNWPGICIESDHVYITGLISDVLKTEDIRQLNDWPTSKTLILFQTPGIDRRTVVRRVDRFWRESSSTISIDIILILSCVWCTQTPDDANASVLFANKHCYNRCQVNIPYRQGTRSTHETAYWVWLPVNIWKLNENERKHMAT